MAESREIARLRKNLTRESLWLYILKVLQDGEMYAYALQKKLESKFGFKPGKITVYKVLYLLKRNGFVQVRKEKVGGRIRKYYSATPKSKQELKKAAKILKKTAEMVGP